MMNITSYSLPLSFSPLSYLIFFLLSVTVILSLIILSPLLLPAEFQSAGKRYFCN